LKVYGAVTINNLEGDQKKAMSLLSFLDREHTVKRGYNRWFVPPAALAIHLAIGQAYAFSVFAAQSIDRRHQITPGDWSANIGWIFSLAIVVLGLSAAVFGKWLERAGPRKAIWRPRSVSAAAFSSPRSASRYIRFPSSSWATACRQHRFRSRHISPVSTLIKWFPDRPGMATGMAIMGFGGGALIGSPLATNLMSRFASPASTGVAQTFVTMGVLYFVFMLFGALIVRVTGSQGFAPQAARTR
jgi:MFS family permease